MENKEEKILPKRAYWELETLRWAKWVFVILGAIAWVKRVPVLPWVLFGVSMAIIGRLVNLCVRWFAFSRPLDSRKLPDLIRAVRSLRFRVAMLFAGSIATAFGLAVWLEWGRWVEAAVFFSCFFLHGCLRNLESTHLLRSWMADSTVPLTVRTFGELYRMGGEEFHQVFVSSPRGEVVSVRIVDPALYRELFPEVPDGGNDF
ncbi:MAG: hypothetical protein IK066_10465 [Kiritimatiellae bacterium]|nr:hypothetical protein [Kiritimatiellia bacterium]